MELHWRLARCVKHRGRACLTRRSITLCTCSFRPPHPPHLPTLPRVGGTSDLDAVSLQRRIGARTGGISFSTLTSQKVGEHGMMSPADPMAANHRLAIRAKGTVEKARDMFDLVHQMLSDAQFDAQPKVRDESAPPPPQPCSRPLAQTHPPVSRPPPYPTSPLCQIPTPPPLLLRTHPSTHH